MLSQIYLRYQIELNDVLMDIKQCPMLFIEIFLHVLLGENKYYYYILIQENHTNPYYNPLYKTKDEYRKISFQSIGSKENNNYKINRLRNCIQEIFSKKPLLAYSGPIRPLIPA